MQLKGRAYSMNRLDQLAQPVRRYGEHIRAILERERREQLEYLDETESLGGGRRIGSAAKKLRRTGGSASAGNNSAMSRSMTHLTAASATTTTTQRGKYSLGGGISSNFRPLGHSRSMDASKSMTHLTNESRYSTTGWSTASNTPKGVGGGGGTPRLQTAATKKYLQNFSNASTTYASPLSSSLLYNNLNTATNLITNTTTNIKQRGQQPRQQQQQQQYQQKQHHHHHNSYQFDRFDPNSLLLMNSSSLLLTAVKALISERSIMLKSLVSGHIFGNKNISFHSTIILINGHLRNADKILATKGVNLLDIYAAAPRRRRRRFLQFLTRRRRVAENIGAAAAAA